MGHVTVRVSQSSFGRETLQPQLRICRTKVFLEPRIEESGTDLPSHHGDDWISKHQYPNEIRDVLLSDCARTHEGADGTLPTSPPLLVLKVTMARKLSLNRRCEPLSIAVSRYASSLATVFFGIINCGVMPQSDNSS